MMPSQKQLKSLTEKLDQGVVVFSFRKQNGEIRYAVGTTNEELIPENKKAKGKRNVMSAVQRYYDLICRDWRTLKKDSLIQIRTMVSK